MTLGTYNMLDFKQAARAILKLRAAGQRIVRTITRSSTVELMRMLEWCATLAIADLKVIIDLKVTSSSRNSPRNSGQGGHASDTSSGQEQLERVAGTEDTFHRVYMRGENQTPKQDARIHKACVDMAAVLATGTKVKIIPGLHGWRYNSRVRRRVPAPSCSVFWDATRTVYKVVKACSGEDDMQRRMHAVKGSRVLPVKDVIELSKGRIAIAMPYTITFRGRGPWGISTVPAFIKCGQQLLQVGVHGVGGLSHSPD